MKVEKNRSNCRKLFGNLIVRNKRATVVASLLIVLMFAGGSGAIEASGVITNSGSMTVTGGVPGLESEPAVIYEDIPCPDGLYYGFIDGAPLPLFQPERLETINNGLRVPPRHPSPVLVDLDADGDQDLVIPYGASWGSSAVGFNYISYIAYYCNNNGVFELQYGEDNPFYGYSYGASSSISLMLADLDADGDMDAVVSDPTGSHYFRNSGTAETAIFTFQEPDDALLGRTVVEYGSALVLADIDADGDFDAVVLLLGSYPELYRNVGTPQSPEFRAVSSEQNPFSPLGDLPYLVPPVLRLVDLDGDGDLDLFQCPSNGGVRYYQNQGTVKIPQFVELLKEKNLLIVLRQGIQV